MLNDIIYLLIILHPIISIIGFSAVCKLLKQQIAYQNQLNEMIYNIIKKND